MALEREVEEKMNQDIQALVIGILSGGKEVVMTTTHFGKYGEEASHSESFYTETKFTIRSKG